MTTLLDAPAPLPVPTTQTLPARIVLIGFMGAGKSTVGHMLAARLGWQFIDTDACVEQRHGCAVADMFAFKGEAAFRQRESAELARALGRQQSVIAIGGGAPEILTNRLLLEQTPGTVVIFLDAPFPVLFDRCVLQEGAAVRPVLLDAVAAQQRFETRAPFYRRCAHHSLQTESLVPEETVTRVLAMVGSEPR